jgi:hypothetical protein
MIKLTLGILVLVCVILPTVGMADCNVITETASLHRELMPIILGWKQALLSKDSQKLASYALTDQQKYVLLHLKDNKSDLYRYLYKGKHSPYNLFKGAKALRIVLVECVEELHAGFGPRLEVYYYDQEKHKLNFPVSMEEYQALFKKGDVFLHYWGKEDGYWHANYEFN